MKLADIGSNSIQVAVVDGAARESFAVLTREKDVVRLSHETLRKGHLAPSAIEQALMLQALALNSQSARSGNHCLCSLFEREKNKGTEGPAKVGNRQ